MKKYLIVLLACLWSFLPVIASAAPCQGAVEASDPGFCSSFVKAAKCYCNDRVGSVVGMTMCKDMDTIYARMMSWYGSVQSACKDQKNTTPEICKDNWNCYLVGGQYSKDNKWCNGTGIACKATNP